MIILKNGSAVINGVVIPEGQVKVLQVLIASTEKLSVPQIALVLGETVSDASIYTQLKRLHKKEFVDREEVVVVSEGRPVKRVKWWSKVSIQ